jgi:hypothetical protein
MTRRRHRAVASLVVLGIILFDCQGCLDLDLGLGEGDKLAPDPVEPSPSPGLPAPPPAPQPPSPVPTPTDPGVTRVSWSVVTVRVDGSVIVGPVVYRIYLRPRLAVAPWNRSDPIKQTFYDVALPAGRWELYVTAIDSAGLESWPSVTVPVDVP